MNIMLIEDEWLAMEELLHLMKPYEKDHSIISFDNGEDALAHALTGHYIPDILITDIRMPGFTGLEVIERLIALYPNIQTIMVSGYNDFEYARSALKLGAKEYLLKPVPADELHAAVERLMDAVHKEKEKSRNVLDLTLAGMIRGIKGKEHADSTHDSSQWLMITILLENWNSPYTWPQMGTSTEVVTAWLRREVDSLANCFDMDGHIRVILLSARVNDRESDIRQKVKSIHDFCCERDSIIIHTSYRMPTAGESMEGTYRLCLELLEQQVRLGAATFMPLSVSNQMESFWDSARRIELHIRELDYAKLQLELRRMLDGLRRDSITVKQMSELLSDFLYALKYTLTGKRSEISVISTDSVYTYLKTCRDEALLQQWISDRLMSMMSANNQTIPQPKQIIPALMDYVQQHYSDKIHLGDFAVRYHVSIGYLSKLFKAETGLNFSDYIVRIRMNKAKELLDGGYKKISEISRLVGYDDPKFFSQTFKRWTGITPQEYKRK